MQIQSPVAIAEAELPNEERIIKAVRAQGFAYAPADIKLFPGLSDRGQLFDAFERQQEEDPTPGRRWRSYSKVSIDRASGKLTVLPSRAYYQSLDYNPDDGGKQRQFIEIQKELLTGPTVSWILQRNLRIASALLPDIGAALTLTAGVHFISYRPEGAAASFSSPLWLHKDDERFVSLTMFNVSENLGGGENVLTPGGRKIQAIVNMRASMDTLFLTHQGFHAVTPMYSKDGRPASRNIILITFD